MCISLKVRKEKEVEKPYSDIDAHFPRVSPNGEFLLGKTPPLIGTTSTSDECCLVGLREKRMMKI